MWVLMILVGLCHLILDLTSLRIVLTPQDHISELCALGRFQY